jgi:hypothetical protein
MPINITLTRVILGAILFTVVPSRVSAEEVQLIPVERKIEADSQRERSSWELTEIESGKRFVIHFVTKLDADAKYKSTTSTYKQLRKTSESLRNAFNKESYEKIEFLRTDLTLEGTAARPMARELSIKANLYWLGEGYDGIRTFYFILREDRGN